MAAVQTINGTKLLIQIGDGNSPEVFTHPCLINAERGIQFQMDVNEFVVPDCITPDAPAWKEITTDGLSATITGGGMLDAGSVGEYFTWWKDGITKHVRIKVDHADGGYWSGGVKCTALELSGNRNEKATNQITLQSDGPMIWTDAA